MSIYTVSQVASYLREVFETNPHLANIYITGEVSNVTASPAGHRYFALKDQGAQLRCVMFRDAGLGGEHVVQGASVTVHGRLGFYHARGDLQLYADLVQPEGVGERHMEFLRVKAQLEGEGLFEAARKRPLPAFPRRVAVVTSRAGAVWHDVRTVVARRYPLVELVLVHAMVQGDFAAGDIVAALRTVDAQDGIDVAILARGGGSLDELSAFNDEAVARAIYAGRVPVVSAVGHETDVTLADLVADARAPTPSAAAEMVVPDRRDIKLRLADRVAQLGAAHVACVSRLRESVALAGHRIERLTPDLATRRQRVDELARAAGAVVARDLAIRREQIVSREARMASLMPANTLARGYALVEHAADGRLVTRTADVAAGDGVAVTVTDGAFRAQVGGDAALWREPDRRPRRKPRRPPAEQLPMWGQP